MAAPDVLNAARFSVAPMMAWTDSLCRQFHRTLSRRTLLYTEMVTAPALVRGGAVHLLDHAPSEHPVAVQLGGSDPDMLRQATELCRAAGYHEINLNVGCPSDRVQSGAFGAALMGTPQVVRNCVAAMCTVSGVEVTVKCRIGIDDQTPQETLPSFLEMVQSTSVRRVIIHARKAWLQGLSPKDNRTIPPLDYPLVEQMALDFPKLHLSINGGVETIAAAQTHLATQLQGVMVGRAAYHNPAGLLMTADSQIFGVPDPHTCRLDVARAMVPVLDKHLAKGGRMHQMTRHMLGLFAGQPGARHWRRTLSEIGADPSANTQTYCGIVKDLAGIQHQNPMH